MTIHARLIFEDGGVFEGRCFTGQGTRTAEVVFNTAMAGYQEVLTDPSYKGQMVVMTYPLIGNYGINEDDIESDQIHLDALIMREYMDIPSNWRSVRTLSDYLKQHDVLGIDQVDTRALTRYLRTKGSAKGLITTSDEPVSDLVAKLKQQPGMVGMNLADQVSCKASYVYEPEGEARFSVAVIDCGVKRNILRQLSRLGVRSTVFPSSTPADTILAGGFDGVLVSNGPGDPEPVRTVIETIQSLKGKLPIFGICLGHQLIGLALGGKTYKLKFGHHGANHPVKNLKTGAVEITSQNHGFCVDPESLKNEDVEVTHVNLNDNTVAGLRHRKDPIFSVQYHPEAGPGPRDSHYLFEAFCEEMAGQSVKSSKSEVYS